MTAVELAAGIQFTMDQRGEVTAIVVQPELWRQIVEALEDAEDRELVAALRARLASAPDEAGAIRWREVADEWA